MLRHRDLNVYVHACAHTHVLTHTHSPSLTIRKLVQLRWQGTEVIVDQGFLSRDTVSRKAFQHLGGEVFSFRNPAQPSKVGEKKQSFSRGLPSEKLRGKKKSKEKEMTRGVLQKEFF